jgi:hypothetical protein
MKALFRQPLNGSLLIQPKANFARLVEFHSTTVLNVRKNGKVAMIADGQISLG